MAVQGGYAPEKRIRFEVIGEAWQLLQQQLSTWIISTLIAGLIIAGLYFVVAAVLGSMSFSKSGGFSASEGSPFSFISPVSIATQIVFNIIIYSISLIIVAGLYRMAVKQIRGEIISVSDIFSTTDVVANILIASILTGLATGIATICCYLPGLAVGGLLMLTNLIIVDQKCGAIEAMSLSFNALKGQWLMATIFFFIIGIIAGAGAIACGIGLLITAPLAILSVTKVYADFFPERFAFGSVTPPVSPVEPSGPISS